LLEGVGIVGIVHMGRSSSLFYQGVLEGHPAILTMPLVGFPKPGQDLDSYYEEDLRPSFRAFDRDIEAELPKGAFLASGRRHRAGGGLRETLIAVHAAYAEARGLSLEQVRHLLIQTHTVPQVRQFERAFPSARFVFTVRDPRANCLSYRRLGKNLHSLLQINSYALYERLRHASLGVRHEDIHCDFETVRRASLAFLEIEDHPQLDQSTMCGKPFLGSPVYGSSSKARTSRPCPDFVNENWRRELSRLDVKRIQHRFGSLMREFGYEPVELDTLRDFVVFQGTRRDVPERWARVARALEGIPLVGEPLLENLARGHWLAVSIGLPWLRIKLRPRPRS
jgi:hypothetical protein